MYKSGLGEENFYEKIMYYCIGYYDVTFISGM